MEHESMHGMHWSKLAIMAGVSFVLMYALMYMMVDVFGNMLPNVNQFYMAGVMTGAMMLVEIAIMREMYDQKTVVVTAGVSAVVLVVCLLFLRNQTGVGDKAFLRSMIPHHGAAILMCEKAKLEDAEIQQLCASILKSQQAEVTWMHEKLRN